MNTLQSRMTHLLRYLQRGIYEKNTEMALALLAALAGESILLLGPPGVAKSMVARRLKKAFCGATSFEYLMSRFSTPDEIFGPVSIARLKSDDVYERATEGFLPTADVVFLDEIWKAGPAIQNTLLTVLNEKLFRNGNKEQHLPLKLLVAASNELPAQGEGLEALWDRFVIRVVCRCIQSESVFRQMLCCDDDEPCADEEVAEPITADEYALWQREAHKVALSQDLLESISCIRQEFKRVEIENTELPRSIYVSDRRWKHIAALLRTSAYLQGRTSATRADLLTMYHCLWNEPVEIAAVRSIVIKSIFAPHVQRLETLAAGVKADLRARRANEALAKAVRENDHRDDDLLIVDRFFYQIENHGTGHTYVFVTDFKRMPVRSKLAAPAQGVIYKDPTHNGRQIVRLFSPDIMAGIPRQNREQVTLCRDSDHIYINGIAFKMRHVGAAVMNPADGSIGGLFDNANVASNADVASATTYAHYEDDVEQVCNDADSLKRALEQNIFVSDDDRKEVDAYMQAFYKQVALCRVDIRRLLYDE